MSASIEKWFSEAEYILRAVLLERMCPTRKNIKVDSLHDALLLGFNWERSPEGSDYWALIHCNLERSRLRPTKDFLRPLQAKLPIPDAALQVESPVPSMFDALLGGFNWEKTPQGFRYWAALADSFRGNSNAGICPAGGCDGERGSHCSGGPCELWGGDKDTK